METEQLCVNTIRVLSADMVHKANSGHTGAPLGLAPVTHVLWSKFFNFEKDWINRDRFVLGPGHASALMYSMLHIYQRCLTMDDLKNFRQFGAKTAGHPEHHLIPEIEATTGPLGQGIGYAIGMAMAELHMAARFNKPGFDVFNHKVFCIVSDGEMMEGVQAEAASLAGHQRLDNLICLYDDNKITIDGSTDITFTENVLDRYRSYGWEVIVVENGNTDLNAIEKAIEAALKVEGKPVLIDLKTTIGYGSDLENTPKVHGSPLNAEQLEHLKEKFGFNPKESFVVPEVVYKYYDSVREKAHQKAEQWNKMMKEYAKQFPTEYAELQELINPDFSVERFRKFMPMDDTKNCATRVSSGVMLNVICNNIPGLFGGTADLTPSNNTELKGFKSFNPSSREGKYIEFGIREHAMMSIANGIQYYGIKGLVPFVATFFTFFQYGLGAVRVASLDNLRIIYIMTHDSIGLGEDGPTHQNVENFAVVRAIPNILLYRPADILETSAAYTVAFSSDPKPIVLALSRQNAPPIPGASFDGALKGGYIIRDDKDAKLILIGTGTEVKLALDTADKLDVPCRVVSMPSMEQFAKQSEEYRKSVLPGNIPTISIEAGVSYGWNKYSHVHFGVETFGISAPASKVYEHFGLTPDQCAERAKKVLDYYSSHPIPDLSAKPEF